MRKFLKTFLTIWTRQKNSIRSIHPVPRQTLINTFFDSKIESNNRNQENRNLLSQLKVIIDFDDFL